MIRVFYLQGWYIVTYALGIYYLNLFIAFLTPKVDPVMDDESGTIQKPFSFQPSDQSCCPSQMTVQRCPHLTVTSSGRSSGDSLSSNSGVLSSGSSCHVFNRLFPKIRHSITKATLIAMFCTFFTVFDIPVFWPILLLYFLTLFAITMKRQIRVSCIRVRISD